MINKVSEFSRSAEALGKLPKFPDTQSLKIHNLTMICALENTIYCEQRLCIFFSDEIILCFLKRKITLVVMFNSKF